MSNKPISTWTRFEASIPPDDRPLDASIFQPLIARRADYQDAFYGRLAESPADCILVVAWNSEGVYDTFAASPEGGTRLLANLAAAGSDGGEAEGDGPKQQQQRGRRPVTTRKVDFGNMPFWWRFGPNTEVRTVYFPSAAGNEQRQKETREAVGRLKGLVLSMGLGIDGRMAHLSPYRGVPECGWVTNEEVEGGKAEEKDGESTAGVVAWEGREASACLWIHYWKNKKAEQTFKTTERRPPPDGESHQPLALEAFEDDLRRLGALGWEDYHVDFEKVPRAL
ncbi:hypothetical protein DL769_009246 [Monosporascus sp. CRB-8-3]|nr:hypothetical protein DL769_009246 [Monosporascus sp. CRB-8-3]